MCTCTCTCTCTCRALGCSFLHCTHLDCVFHHVFNTSYVIATANAAAHPKAILVSISKFLQWHAQRQNAKFCRPVLIVWVGVFVGLLCKMSVANVEKGVIPETGAGSKKNKLKKLIIRIWKKLTIIRKIILTARSEFSRISQKITCQKFSSTNLQKSSQFSLLLPTFIHFAHTTFTQALPLSYLSKFHSHSFKLFGVCTRGSSILLHWFAPWIVEGWATLLVMIDANVCMKAQRKRKVQDLQFLVWLLLLQLLLAQL